MSATISMAFCACEQHLHAFRGNHKITYTRTHTHTHTLRYTDKMEPETLSSLPDRHHQQYNFVPDHLCVGPIKCDADGLEGTTDQV